MVSVKTNKKSNLFSDSFRKLKIQEVLIIKDIVKTENGNEDRIEGGIRLI